MPAIKPSRVLFEVFVCLCCVSWLPLGALAQESCAEAVELDESETNTGTIVPTATSSVDFGLCGADLGASVGDVLLMFEAGEQGTYTINACSEDSSFSLSVLSGSCDDMLTCLTTTEECSVTLDATAEETYFFLLHTTSSLNYNVKFDFDMSTHPCSSAPELSLGVTTLPRQSAIPSNEIFRQNRCRTQLSPGLGFAYFNFVVPDTSRYKIRTDSGYPFLFTGTCEENRCYEAPSSFAGVIPSETSQEVTFDAASGDEFIVVIRGITIRRRFDVLASAFDFNEAPCLDQTEVFLDTPLVASAVGSSSTNFESCGTYHDADASDVFFRFVAPKQGMYSVDTCGTADTSFTSKIRFIWGFKKKGGGLCGWMSEIRGIFVCKIESLRRVTRSASC